MPPYHVGSNSGYVVALFFTMATNRMIEHRVTLQNLSVKAHKRLRRIDQIVGPRQQEKEGQRSGYEQTVKTYVPPRANNPIRAARDFLSLSLSDHIDQVDSGMAITAISSAMLMDACEMYVHTKTSVSCEP